MKKITTFFVFTLLGISLLFADVVRKDTLISSFEHSSLYLWGGTSNIVPAIVDNISPTGLNTSSKVLKITANNAAGWEGIYSTTNIPLSLKISSNPSTGYRYMHFKMYATTQSDFWVGLRDVPTNSNIADAHSSNVPANVNQWDTVTVDLLNFAWAPGVTIDGITCQRIQLRPGGSTDGKSYTVYLDDIYFSNSPYSNGGPVITEPALLQDAMISTFENGNDPNTTQYIAWGGTWGGLTISAVDNPSITALNPSNKALKLIAAGTVDGYCSLSNKGASLSVTTSYNPTQGYRYLHFKVYKEGSGQQKLQWILKKTGGSEKTPPEILAPAIINQWDTVKIDLLANSSQSWGVQHGGVYDYMKLQPNKGFTSEFTFYIDDIYFSNNPYAKNGSGITTFNENVTKKEHVFVSRLDNNTIRIQAPESDGKLKIAIYNIQGQLLKRINNVSSELLVNLPDNSLYILQATDKSFISSIKF